MSGDAGMTTYSALPYRRLPRKFLRDGGRRTWLDNEGLAWTAPGRGGELQRVADAFCESLAGKATGLRVWRAIKDSPGHAWILISKVEHDAEIWTLVRLEALGPELAVDVNKAVHFRLSWWNKALPVLVFVALIAFLFGPGERTLLAAIVIGFWWFFLAIGAIGMWYYWGRTWPPSPSAVQKTKVLSEVAVRALHEVGAV